MIQETVELGPIHTWLPGAMKLRLGMRGDHIQEVSAEFGYLSRSIEKKMLNCPQSIAQLRFGRIEPESALLLDRLYSEALEKRGQTEISSRILWIREITSSLCELNGFLRYLSKMSKRLGNPVLTHVILKHRESLLDLIELLTGSRYGYYYLVPGGARYDLTEGFQERLEKWLIAYRLDHSRIESLFLWTHSLQNRLKTMGRVLDQGSYGFVTESSVESSRHGLVSHVESRLLYALQCCSEVAEDLQKVVEERHVGVHLVKSIELTQNEEVKHSIVTARGEFDLKIKIDDDNKVQLIEISTPSHAIQKTIVEALQDESFEDISVILESLNFSIPEIDR